MALLGVSRLKVSADTQVLTQLYLSRGYWAPFFCWETPQFLILISRRAAKVQIKKPKIFNCKIFWRRRTGKKHAGQGSLWTLRPSSIWKWDNSGQVGCMHGSGFSRRWYDRQRTKNAKKQRPNRPKEKLRSSSKPENLVPLRWRKTCRHNDAPGESMLNYHS